MHDSFSMNDDDVILWHEIKNIKGNCNLSPRMQYFLEDTFFYTT